MLITTIILMYFIKYSYQSREHMKDIHKIGESGYTKLKLRGGKMFFITESKFSYHKSNTNDNFIVTHGDVYIFNYTTYSANKEWKGRSEYEYILIKGKPDNKLKIKITGLNNNTVEKVGSSYKSSSNSGSGYGFMIYPELTQNEIIIETVNGDEILVLEGQIDLNKYIIDKTKINKNTHYKGYISDFNLILRLNNMRKKPKSYYIF